MFVAYDLRVSLKHRQSGHDRDYRNEWDILHLAEQRYSPKLGTQGRETKASSFRQLDAFSTGTGERTTNE